MYIIVNYIERVRIFVVFLKGIESFVKEFGKFDIIFGVGDGVIVIFVVVVVVNVKKNFDIVFLVVRDIFLNGWVVV